MVVDLLLLMIDGCIFLVLIAMMTPPPPPRGWKKFDAWDGRFYRRRPGPWGYAVDVDYCRKPNNKERRRGGGGEIIAKPGNSDAYYPAFSTCLSPGKIVVCMAEENASTLYELDWKNNTWRVYQKDLPYSQTKLLGCVTVVDHGILYIYDDRVMQLTCYDIHSKKELYVVALPRSFWFGLKGRQEVQLIVLSKNRFCVIIDMQRNYYVNKLDIYYTRFSVSCFDDHLPKPKPTVVVEEKQSFTVGGSWLLNVLAVDPLSDVSNGSSSSSNAMMLSMSNWRNSRNSEEICLENYINTMLVKKQGEKKFKNHLRWSKCLRIRQLEASMRRLDQTIWSLLKKSKERLKKSFKEVIKQDNLVYNMYKDSVVDTME